MTGKRPHETNGEGGDQKRVRAEDGSPRAAPPSDMAARMAAIKARLAANKPKEAANPTSRPPQSAASPSPAPAKASPTVSDVPSSPAQSGDVAEARAAAQKRIAEIRARMAAKGGSSQAPTNGANAGTGSTASPPPRPDPIADARARAAEIAKQHQKRAQGAAPPSAPAPPPRVDGKGARGGLGIGLHPSLLGDSGGEKAKAGHLGPKFTTTKGNQQPEKPKVNPYLAAVDELPTDEDPTFAPAVRRNVERKSKQLVFSQKGKYMAQANALRQQAKLEEMKRRIAAENRKTEIEEASDKAFLVPPPPDVEWWDEGLLPGGQDSYDDWEKENRNRIETEDSIITALIQRPVLLQAPQDKFISGPKPLMLTQKEQKKIRRQRRMADMKEEQAKIRLGLVEPPPPKVKKSNMMRVLGEQAVKDPTAVEARVNREIAQRAHDHEQANLDRMLTPEQRAEKLKRQQAGDEAKGVKMVVFRVDDLSCGKHRYQVDVNAKQNAITGIVILNPNMNLIIVEGGSHSIKAYKKLMLNRVKWTENFAPVGEVNPTTFTGTTDGSNANVTAGTRGSGSKAAEWCNPLDEDGELKDLSGNRCVLVWEGEESERTFKRWGSRACETDGEAKDVLSRTKMENMWTLARSK
ncbi:U4 U5 U6 small nuclear ribonucleo prp3 [Lecanosticta acicola]|uniref:U4 U5 U6 small nuclear ribonucleo prp3 n=1 Tax=Lecanosticta acicola TaxID=111012 RepID=A0AAI8YZR9_9PEZI|nr:U4 U5 U6 small nuclear ribonucleo prp3 [Lecanosticta acicola]